MRVLSVIFSAGGVGLLVWGLFFYNFPTLRRTVFFITFGVLLQLPLVYTLLKTRLTSNSELQKKHIIKDIFRRRNIFVPCLLEF